MVIEEDGCGTEELLRGGFEIQGHGEEVKQELLVKGDSVTCSDSLRVVQIVIGVLKGRMGH